MITKYIVELLKENSRVIVPDLGAFMASLKSGAPKDSNEVSDKNISFNDFLKYNDGLLVNQIIKEEKVSKEDATAKIKEFVVQTDKLIRKGEKVAVEEIGSLYLDDRGSIKFTESSQSEAAKPAGKKVEEKVVEEKKTQKPKVEEKRVEEKKIEEKKVEEKKAEIQKKEEKPEAKKPEVQGVGKEVLKSLEKKEEVKKEETKKEAPKKETEKTPVTKEPVKKEEVKPYVVPKDNSNQIIIWTSVAVVAIIAIVLVVLNFGKIKSWIVPEKPVVVEKVEKPTTPKVVQKVDSVKKETVKETSPPPPPKEFHLIAGSFKVESNAINFVEKLKKDGYSSEIVGVRNGYHFVSFSSHETRAQAVQAMNQIKKTNEQVWILRMKKQ